MASHGAPGGDAYEEEDQPAPKSPTVVGLALQSAAAAHNDSLTADVEPDMDQMGSVISEPTDHDASAASLDTVLTDLTSAAELQNISAVINVAGSESVRSERILRSISQGEFVEPAIPQQDSSASIASEGTSSNDSIKSIQASSQSSV